MTGGVGFGFKAFTSCGSAMNAPSTDPRTRIDTRNKDQSGTVFLAADPLGWTWLNSGVQYLRKWSKASLLPRQVNHRCSLFWDPNA